MGVDGLYYIRRRPAEATLYRTTLVGRWPEALASWRTTALPHEPGLAVSPDGTRALIALVDRAESDIMLDRIEP